MGSSLPLGDLHLEGGLQTAMITRVDAPATEQEIARDLARRAVPVAPVLIAAGAVGWGVDGGISAAYAVALVVANFLLSAAIMTRTARISLAALMGGVMLGYIVRLVLVSAAVLVVIHASWMEVVPLGLTLVVTHLGLLFWETKYVSATLAYPGLKPDTALGASRNSSRNDSTRKRSTSNKEKLVP